MLAYWIICFTGFVFVSGIKTRCQLGDVQNLLDGCKFLSGLNITSSGGTVVNDHNCDVLLPKQVYIEEPIFQCELVNPDKFYTIIMIDPDAPPKREGEFYIHLLKSNVPGLTLTTGDGSKGGKDNRGYKPPTPPRGSGPHRYISIIYEQEDGNSFLPIGLCQLTMKSMDECF